MGELIWVGNTLLPRGLVYGMVGIAVLAVVGAYVLLTESAPTHDVTGLTK